MLRGEEVTLRSVAREDLPRLWQFKNDLRFELAGGGRPPVSQRETARGGRDGAIFAIAADGKGIGDRDYWGRAAWQRPAKHVAISLASLVVTFG